MQATKFTRNRITKATEHHNMLIYSN